MTEFEIVDAAFLAIKEVIEKSREEELSEEDSNTIKFVIKTAMRLARQELSRGN